MNGRSVGSRCEALTNVEITSKRQFYALWEAGVLGNRTFIWHKLEDALASGCPKIGFREIRKSLTAGAGAWELAERAQAGEVHDRWKVAGRQFIMDGSVPNDHSTLQGEVCRTFRGLESFLCERAEVAADIRLKNACGAWLKELEPGLPPMRQTMRDGWHQHRGYAATHALLERYMDPSSRDDLDMLLELYPEATVEFTCFDIDTGMIPNRNTIFWETRNY